MKITGTNKIRGILDLSSIGLQISKGSSYSISNEDFNKHEVQQAINLGYLKSSAESGGNYGPADGPVTSVFHVKNMHKRNLTISCLSADIKPGQIFTLTEKQIRQPEIRSALGNGLLEIITPGNVGNGDIPESTMKVGKLLDDNDGNIIEMVEEMPAEVVASSPIDDEIKAKTMAMSQKEDPKTEAMIWNPANNPVLKEMPNVNIWDGNKKRLPPKKEKKQRGRPRKYPEAKDEIEFVDHMQEKEAVDAHPVLKSKTLVNNGEIQFLE